MATVKDLKDFIREHKKRNCPAYSKLRKAELYTIATKYGYKGEIKRFIKPTKKKTQPKTKKRETKKRETKKRETKKEVKQTPYFKNTPFKKGNDTKQDIKDIKKWVNYTSTYLPYKKRNEKGHKEEQAKYRKDSLKNPWRYEDGFDYNRYGADYRYLKKRDDKSYKVMLRYAKAWGKYDKLHNAYQKLAKSFYGSEEFKGSPLYKKPLTENQKTAKLKKQGFSGSHISAYRKVKWVRETKGYGLPIPIN